MHSYTCAISEGDQSEGLQVLEEIWQKHKQLNFTSLKKSGYRTMFSLKSTFYITQYIVKLAMLSALFSYSQHHVSESLCKCELSTCPTDNLFFTFICWMLQLSLAKLQKYVHKQLFISNCSYTHKYFPVKCLEISVFHGQFLRSMQYKVFIQNIIYLNFLSLLMLSCSLNTVLNKRGTIQIYPNRSGNQLETSLKQA